MKGILDKINPWGCLTTRNYPFVSQSVMIDPPIYQ